MKREKKRKRKYVYKKTTLKRQRDSNETKKKTRRYTEHPENKTTQFVIVGEFYAENSLSVSHTIHPFCGDNGAATETVGTRASDS